MRNKSDPLRTDNKLKRAEAILEHLVPPGVDIYNPDTDINAVIDSITSGSFMMGLDSRSSRLKSLTENNRSSGSPVSTSQFDATELKIILPPKNSAVQLIEAVWENACVLLRFYHRPSFIRDLDILYDMEPELYGDKQFRMLPLVYSVLACGVLFCMDRADELDIKDSSEGYKYFEAARRLIDLTDIRDINAIQSIVMMTIFLQCSARISTCYSYLGIAVRAANRLGLHRKVNHNFNPIELETRKRLFWCIRKMDIYINAILGMPRSMDDEDFDQEFPIEMDDECITEDGYYPKDNQGISSIAMSNAHSRMMNILHHIHKDMYLIKFPPSPSPPHKTNNGSAAVSDENGHLSPQQFDLILNRCIKLEKELAAWVASLPPEMVPGADVGHDHFKANRLLSISCCAVQLILYRPFIHFGSDEFAHLGENHRVRFFARKCISVARRVTYLANELVSKNMLNGAYWFTTYAIFFSVSCLLYYIHENPDSPDILAIRKDAERGKESLNKLKSSSMAADRIFNVLNVMFDRLNCKTSTLRKTGDIGEASIPDILEYTKEDTGPLLSSTPSQDPNSDTLGGLTGENNSSEFVKGVVTDSNNSSKNSQFSNTTPTGGYTDFYTPAGSTSGPELPQFFKDTNLDLNSPTTSANTPSQPVAYVPGVMDQFDSQLFGRFLPPYMMSTEEYTSPQQQRSQQQQQQQQHSSEETTEPSSGYNEPVPVVVGPILEQNPVNGNAEPVSDETRRFSFANGTSDQERRFSVSNLFSSDWDDFLSQHTELSGINSFANTL